MILVNCTFCQTLAHIGKDGAFLRGRSVDGRSKVNMSSPSGQVTN